MPQQNVNPRIKFPHRSLAWALLLVCVWNPPASANPTNRDPSAGLDTHNTIAAASDLAKTCYGTCNRIEAIVNRMSQESNPSKLSGKQIVASASELWKTLRDSVRLREMKEPAGLDISIKAYRLNQSNNENAMRYMTTPEGQNVRRKLIVKLTRNLPQLRKALDSMEKDLVDGNLDRFEQQIESIGMELIGDLLHFSNDEKPRYALNFYALSNDNRLTAARTRRYLDQSKAAAAKQVAAAQAFPAEAARVVGEIASGSTAHTADGKSLSASESFAHQIDLWEVASVGLIRASAIDLAFGSDNDSRAGEMASLRDSATGALVELIDAASQSSSMESVRGLHADLILQISVVQRRMGGEYRSGDWLKACEASLEKLAAKDPNFSTQVAAYRRATAEPLAWRRQFAAEQAEKIVESIPTARSVMGTKTVVKSNLRPLRHAGTLLPTVIAPTSLAGESAWIMDEAASRLIGKEVSEVTMLRLSPTANVGMVPFEGGHYSAVVLPIPVDKPVATLRSSLAVTEANGPLTIDSVNAISAAELGDLEGVGGMIKAVTMESTITRMITLPDAAYLLAPLGKLPPMPDRQEAASAICWRLDLQPTWAYSRYFNVRLN